MKTKLSSILSVAILLSMANARAATDGEIDPKDNSKEAPPMVKSWCETPTALEIRIGLPGWLAGLSGDSGVAGIVSSPDVKFHELFNHLTHVPIVLAADVRYKRWEFFGDGQYEELGADASLPGLFFTDASLHVKSAFVEGFLGYRLINCTRGSLTLFAGARYNYMALHLRINDNGDARLQGLRRLFDIPGKLNFDGSFDWVDPVVGARGRMKLWKAVSFYAEGDIGGFDANGGSAFETHLVGNTIVKSPIDSEDWSYQIQGGLEVQLTRRIWTQVGWRYLKNDYVNSGFTNKTALSGPILQTGINF